MHVASLMDLPNPAWVSIEKVVSHMADDLICDSMTMCLSRLQYDERMMIVSIETHGICSRDVRASRVKGACERVVLKGRATRHHFYHYQHLTSQ